MDRRFITVLRQETVSEINLSLVGSPSTFHRIVRSSKFSIFVEDPLDKKYMSIRESEIGVGEGAYATKDISKGAILAIYGGHLFTLQDYSEVSALQTVEREKFRRSGKYTDSQIEDIAEEYYTYR